MKLNAEQAKIISESNNIDKIVDSILDRIKKAAESGLRYIRVRDHGFGSGSMYIEENWPNFNKNIVEELRKLGFEVNVGIIDGQFVDVFLDIRW